LGLGRTKKRKVLTWRMTIDTRAAHMKRSMLSQSGESRMKSQHDEWRKMTRRMIDNEMAPKQRRMNNKNRSGAMCMRLPAQRWWKRRMCRKNGTRVMPLMTMMMIHMSIATVQRWKKKNHSQNAKEEQRMTKNHIQSEREVPQRKTNHNHHHCWLLRTKKRMRCHMKTRMGKKMKMTSHSHQRDDRRLLACWGLNSYCHHHIPDHRRRRRKSRAG
jgi:hypothetical protein